MLAVAALLATCADSQTSRPQTPPLLLGAAWYPEQWPESRWEADLSLMEQAHLHVVRVGEFAWSSEEPTEGHFDFHWLEHAVRLAAKHHIAVVIGTPTDAPPAWLTTDHPETLRADANGRRAEHGNRRQFNYANPLYRHYCEEIAGRLAERFGHDPNVIGWQIGNEITDESFDADTKRQFQDWLRHRYSTLDALNRAWVTSYWSQTYDRWSEIPLPSGGGNPGLLLDHKHFVSDTWRDFLRVQVEAIRGNAERRQFITTNVGGLGWSDNFDHYEIARELDLSSWDDYVGEGHLNVARNGFMHDFVRGWKRANFWVMETQPGSVNWAPVNNMLDPGETRAMAWQAIGHGADAILYWQWRSALNGQEQYHGAIVGPDGGPLPVFPEIGKLGSDLERAGASLEGTTPMADVALLHSYDSRWAIDFQPHQHNYDQLEMMLDFYRPLREHRISVDVVDTEVALNGHKLVMAPSLNVISPALGEKLLAYVRQGGHLLLGPRSGMKDEHNSLNTDRQPGPLVDALGGRVEQYYALESPVPLSGQPGTGSASIWAEQLSTHDEGVQVLMRYGKSNGWLDGQPAMISRKVGKGRITYLGAVADENLMRGIVQWALDLAEIKPEFEELPPSVEVSRRAGKDREVFVLINHGRDPVKIPMPGGMRDVLNGEMKSTEILLGTQGVAVLERLRHE